MGEEWHTVKRPREMVPMNLQRVAVVRDIVFLFFFVFIFGVKEGEE